MIEFSLIKLILFIVNNEKNNKEYEKYYILPYYI